MKKTISILMLLFAVVLSGMAQKQRGKNLFSASADYEIVVLTFEDGDYKGGGNMLGNCDWSSLIDTPQYGGPLLYGTSGAGFGEGEDIYYWYDENNTGLFSQVNDAYGSYCYWSGGAALSNYVTHDYTGGGYMNQLDAYNPDPDGKGGHNNSDNFIVLYGYDDDSPWSMDSRPVFTFYDGEPKVIDHLYLALNAYTLNVLKSGNDLSAAANPGDFVNITFEGLDADGNSTGLVSVPIIDENAQAFTGYKMVDLSVLGAIVTLRVNMVSNIDNGYGLSIPAYCILDDIAVRMPKETTEPDYATVSITDAGIATFCSEYNLDFSASDVKAYAVTSQVGNYVILEEVTEVPAGMGVILKGEAGSYEIPYTETAPFTCVNYMTGVTTATAVPVTENGCTNYILARDTWDDTVSFYPLSASHTLAAGKAYLSLPGTQQTRLRMVFDNETNGIEGATQNSSLKTQDCYNLQGQKVGAGYKGIVIKNGKKILK